MSLPFFFSGIVVSLALTRSPYPVGVVYGVDLLGAALGCLGALVLLNLVSGPSAVLWIAVLAAAGGLLCAGGARRRHAAGHGRWLASPDADGRCSAPFAMLAVANSLIEGIRPTVVKDQIERPEHIAYEKWNSFSRITVDPAEGAPALWGRSSQLCRR